MTMDCEGVGENVDAWALGALDVEDARALEVHLAGGCARCAALADEARALAASIALAVPLEPASNAVKARLMASAAVLGGLRRGATVRWWPAAAAAALVAGVATLAWASFLQVRVAGLEDRNAGLRAGATAQARTIDAMRAELQATVEAQDTFVSILSEPDARGWRLVGTATAPDASGTYRWSTARRMGALDAVALPPLEPDRAYQLWIVYEGRWVSGGSFEIDEAGHGRLLVRPEETDEDHGPVVGYAVTVEPAGGAAERTGPMVLQTVR